MLEFGRKKIQNLLPLGLRQINFEFSTNKNPENFRFSGFFIFYFSKSNSKRLLSRLLFSLTCCSLLLIISDAEISFPL